MNTEEKYPHRWRIRDLSANRTVFERWDFRLMRCAHLIASYWAWKNRAGYMWTISKLVSSKWLA